MGDLRNTSIKLFLIVLIFCTLVYAVSAQENETKDSIQQEAGITTTLNETISDLSQNTDGDSTIEIQSNFDRSLDILNIVATLLGVLVGLLTLILAIVGGFGFFEIKKWREVRKNIDEDVDAIKEIRNRAEDDLNVLREGIKNNLPSLDEKPSQEIITSLDDFASKSELLEIMGASLKFEDYFSRATDFYFKGKYELALKSIEKAIELESGDSKAWYNKGVVLSDLGRHELALKSIEKAIELEPNDFDAWSYKGAILRNLGSHELALKVFEKAIELEPGDSKAWYNKGIVLRDLGSHELALNDFEKAIELESGDSKAWYNKGVVLRDLGRDDEALKSIEKAIELEPNDFDAWSSKGVLLRDFGRDDEALKSIEKAIELNPESANVLYNYACIYYSIKGDKEKALSFLRKAIEIDASYKDESKKDKDFENLWEDEDFKNLTE